MIRPRSCRDRATIVRRSWSWLSIDRRPIQWKDCGIDSAMKEAMITLDRGHDRAVIGPWSRHDQVLIFPSSDEDHDLMKIWRARELHVLPVWWRLDVPESSTRHQGEMKIGANRGHLMEIGWSQCVHAVLPDLEIVKDRDRLMKPRAIAMCLI